MFHKTQIWFLTLTLGNPHLTVTPVPRQELSRSHTLLKENPVPRVDYFPSGHRGFSQGFQNNTAMATILVCPPELDGKTVTYLSQNWLEASYLLWLAPKAPKVLCCYTGYYGELSAAAVTQVWTLQQWLTRQDEPTAAGMASLLWSNQLLSDWIPCLLHRRNSRQVLETHPEAFGREKSYIIGKKLLPLFC